MTLTYRMPEAQTQAEAATVIRAAWVHLRKRICRKLGVPTIKYVLIIEWTKRGAPHIHAMLECAYVAQRWLSKQWRELTGSSVVDIRRIKSQSAAAHYLTAYLTKDQAMPKGKHKYSASRGYLPKLPPREYADDEEKPTYYYDSRGLDVLEQAFKDDGLGVARLTEDCIVIYEPSGGRIQRPNGPKPPKPR